MSFLSAIKRNNFLLRKVTKVESKPFHDVYCSIYFRMLKHAAQGYGVQVCDATGDA